MENNGNGFSGGGQPPAPQAAPQAAPKQAPGKAPKVKKTQPAGVATASVSVRSPKNCGIYFLLQLRRWLCALGDSLFIRVL